MEYRPDNMQRADGCITADLTRAHNGNTDQSRCFFNAGLAVFHLMFWRIFNWNADLESLSFLNRAIMQVLNISLIIIFVIFSYISFAHPDELVTTPPGQALVLLIAMFWQARGIQQILFFKLSHRV
jgi:hypothetical protein